jgi:hypothetical protein
MTLRTECKIVTSELIPLFFFATLTLEHVTYLYVWCRLLQEGVGGSFQQYFYNRYKIVVYTGLRSDCIKNHASRNEARRIAAMRISQR